MIESWDSKRMQAAKSNAEVGDYVNPEDDDWLEQVQALTPEGRGVDFTFECSGYPDCQQKYRDALRHYGTPTLLGYAAYEGPEFTWSLNTEYGL